MKTVEKICINCPRGCNLKITIDGDDIKVTGNTCPLGEKYGISEIKNPVRIVTSIARTNKNNYVSCKTDKPVSKDRMFSVIDEIKKITVNEPVSINDILIRNVCGLDANVIATKNIK